MRDQQPYRRTTSTPRRRRPDNFRASPRPGNRPPRGSGPGTGLLLLAVVPVVILFALLLTRGDGGPSKDPIPDLRVQAEPAGAPAPAAEPKAAAPCPYCNQDPQRWRQTSSVPPPEISGQSAVVIEASCGRMVYGLRQDDRHPPASIAKVVTALVVADAAKPTDRVDIKIDGWTLSVEDDSTIMGLEAGMNLTVEELLYGLLLPSGNDAAIALADHLGGQRSFVERMNQRVAKLGLTNTRMANPDGRDHPDQYTSALDIALLGRDLMANPTLRPIAGTQKVPAEWDKGRFLWNNNFLVAGYQGGIGIKMGYTEIALETMVGAAVRDGRELHTAVLKSDWAYLDTKKLLDWAFANTKPAC